jgi:hypothetical protein
VTKEEVLAQIDRGWANLTAAIDGLSTDRWGEPGVTGEWSVKDVLGHVAFWDRYSAEAVRRTTAGDPLPTGHDWQAMNDADYVAKVDWSVAAIQTELAEAHADILAAYRAFPDLTEDLAKEDWEHYDEHAAEIRAWREREGI